MIPKIIHQTFPNGDLPADLERSVNGLREMNQEFDYKLWTDDEIPEYINSKYGKEFRDAYLFINPNYGAARADFFRYLLLHNEGGFYFDIKSSTRQPLRNMVYHEDRYIVFQWPTNDLHPEIDFIENGEYLQWFIASEPKHEFLGQVIDRVYRNIMDYTVEKNGVGRLAVLRMTGPIPYSLAIHPMMGKGYGERLYGQIDEHLLYSTVGDHRECFKRHYSSQRCPLVGSTGPSIQ